MSVKKPQNPVSKRAAGSNRSSRVIRGGGWNNFSGSLRSSYRNNYGTPSLSYDDRGFRIARTKK